MGIGNFETKSIRMTLDGQSLLDKIDTINKKEIRVQPNMQICATVILICSSSETTILIIVSRD